MKSLDILMVVGENRIRGTIESIYSLNRNLSVRLLTAAGVLMLLSGFIFGFTQQWICAALVWAGAFGRLAAALNFKNRKG